NRKKINDQFGKIGGGAFNVAKSVAAAVAVAITVIVLSLLMILYGPDMLKGALDLLPPPRRRRVAAVLHDCSRALTGYVFGNFLISIIAGGATFVALFGLLGALLAIPAAGVIQVIVRDLWDNRRNRPKDEPTIGTDEVPVSQTTDVDAAPAPKPTSPVQTT